MIRLSTMALMTASLLPLAGCDQEQQAVREAAPVPVTATAAPTPQPHVVEIRAVGKTFQGPQEIPSGWTTFKFVNASSMIHFAMIDVPPEGITAEIMSDAVMQPFQDAMDAMKRSR